MLRRVWVQTTSTSIWKPKVEEHCYSDGTLHYSFRDRHGRPYDLKDWNEAWQTIQHFHMEDVTVEMYNWGWISKEMFDQVRADYDY